MQTFDPSCIQKDLCSFSLPASFVNAVGPCIHTLSWTVGLLSNSFTRESRRRSEMVTFIKTGLRKFCLAHLALHHGRKTTGLFLTADTDPERSQADYAGWVVMRFNV